MCVKVRLMFHSYFPPKNGQKRFLFFFFFFCLTDSGGMPDRQCTLTGSQEAVTNAKDMVEKIISRAQGMGEGIGMETHMAMMSETSRIEIMIPGNKVGLVIGKGGETIRQLQVRYEIHFVHRYFRVFFFLFIFLF